MHQHLEHRHVLADAMPWADAEGYIGESMPLLGIGAGETVGPEFLRFAPERRMTVQHVGADEHIGTRRDREAAELVRLEGAPRNEPARRIQAQRFLEHLMSERQ